MLNTTPPRAVGPVVGITRYCSGGSHVNGNSSSFASRAFIKMIIYYLYAQRHKISFTSDFFSLYVAKNIFSLSKFFNLQRKVVNTQHNNEWERHGSSRLVYTLSTYGVCDTTSLGGVVAFNVLAACLSRTYQRDRTLPVHIKQQQNCPD